MNLKTLALILKGLRVSGSWSQCMRKKTERGLSMNLLVGQASRLPLGRLAPAFVASETPAQAAGMAAPLPTAQFRRQPTASCVLGAVVRCTFRTSRRVPFPNG